jgi:hypothetical protein
MFSDAATALLRDLGVAFSSGSAVFPKDSTRTELLVRLSMPAESGSRVQKKLKKKSKKRKEAEASTRCRDGSSSDENSIRPMTALDGKVHDRGSDADKESRKEKKRRKRDKSGQ